MARKLNIFDMAAKQTKARLMAKEGDIIKAATIYCAKHHIELTGQHKLLLKVMMREFFTSGVAPLMRDIYEDNIKAYHEERKDP